MESLEDFKAYLPKYLTPAEKAELFEQLKLFPQNKNFYFDGAQEEELLQGDGWKGFVAINFCTLEKKVVSGIIFSNSCDISQKNRHDFSPRALFAPIILVSKYIQLLNQIRPEADIANKISSIRRQETTSIFYLPPMPSGEGEAMVLLDDVHAHPLDHFMRNERSRLFRLNQFGFYVFLFKLSIHLTRFQEDVHRFALQ